MTSTYNVEKVSAAEFARLTDPFRRELLAHCYRILGSLHDAEDQVQETYLRAWRAFDDFEGRSSVRSWLYRIATNACLAALESRGRRPLPAGFADDEEIDVPDTSGPADPAAVVTSRESMRIAMAVAGTHLPPKQRAVLLLRDVLGMPATEVAELLGMSGAAVHSMVRRARAQLARAPRSADDVAEPADLGERELLDRYADALENGDVDGLVELLKDDAVCETVDEMYSGRQQVARYLSTCPAFGNCRMVPFTVDGRPGFGMYRRTGTGIAVAFALVMLAVTDGIQRMVVVKDTSVFPSFGLPRARPDRPAGR
ncbi:RNA polymerase subunit sigma-70 [Pseudonocardia sp. TRM90224]|uniref:RNA polymerase subunit sigma-70 n=1 Tax=Pseudonocardia sp. TRM90224 TaxID=2812678 RepID=UPI001E459D79|nr:RNA polymerase subunit sigma-70 [Pseudonocardia sp. TRM90224]